MCVAKLFYFIELVLGYVKINFKIFANIMSKIKNIIRYGKRWRLKYRLVVLNNENLEELISLKLSKINALVIISSVTS